MFKSLIISQDNSLGSDVDTGFGPLDTLLQLGFPIILLLMVSVTSTLIILRIRNNKISIHKSMTWIVLNILLLGMSIYLIISVILAYANVTSFNVFNEIGHYLGISNSGQEWLIFIMLIFISFTYLKLFRNTLELATLKDRQETLSREIAILNGKIDLLLKNEIKSKKHK